MVCRGPEPIFGRLDGEMVCLGPEPFFGHLDWISFVVDSDLSSVASTERNRLHWTRTYLRSPAGFCLSRTRTFLRSPQLGEIACTRLEPIFGRQLDFLCLGLEPFFDRLDCLDFVLPEYLYLVRGTWAHPWRSSPGDSMVCLVGPCSPAGLGKAQTMST